MQVGRFTHRTTITTIISVAENANPLILLTFVLADTRPRLLIPYVVPPQLSRKPPPDRAYEGLPPGLDPVKAGRLGLWLLGKRNQARAARRRFHPTREHVGGLVGGPVSRLLDILLPWTVHEYPGQIKALAALIGGIREATAKDYLYRPENLSKRGAERLAQFCDDRAAMFAGLAKEFAAMAEAKDGRNELARWHEKQRQSGGG